MVEAHPPNVQAYYSSIALNNVGVSLLELHAYRQARITFNDALYAMRAAFRAAPVKATEASFETLADIGAKVQNANKCLAESEANTSKAPTVALPTHRSLSFTSSIGDIQVHLGMPIRIDEFNKQEGLGDRDQDFESAILMYNYALAYLFCSKTCTTKSLPVKLRSDALKLFDMAYQVINRKLLSLTVGEDGSVREISFLTFAIMVLHVHAHVLTEAGMHSEACECYERLVCLGTVLSSTGIPAGAADTMPIAAGAA